MAVAAADTIEECGGITKEHKSYTLRLGIKLVQQGDTKWRKTGLASWVKGTPTIPASSNRSKIQLTVFDDGSDGSSCEEDETDTENEYMDNVLNPMLKKAYVAYAKTGDTADVEKEVEAIFTKASEQGIVTSYNVKTMTNEIVEIGKKHKNIRDEIVSRIK